MLFGLIALHAAAGLVVLVAARRLGRWGFVVGGVAPVASVLVALSNAGAVLDGRSVSQGARWVPQLGLTLDLRLDAFGLLMVALVSGIGALVFAYGWHYFDGSPHAGRAAGLLTLFAGSMLGVVVADNLLVLYGFWELTSITSYLLIGLHDDDAEARDGALHALLVTGMGGLAMLGGFILLGHAADTMRLSALLADPPVGATVPVALALVLLGAFTKSAQYPFHSWLPRAMVAPTPISAYLHSAAMVKAGVYLVARFAPSFAGVWPWRPLVLGVGLLTMVAGGLRALRPFDLKQLLAFGTISQLGFLIVLFGIGRPEATAAGCALLLAHALFKAALFMVVGIVDHAAHTRDVRRLPLLHTGWRATRAVAFVSAASMAAVPPLAGFVAKEQAYGALVDGSAGERTVLAVLVVGSMLTVAYSARMALALWRPDLVAGSPDPRATLDAGPGVGIVVPGVVLATATVLFGLWPAAWSGLVDGAANALDPAAHAHLELWHGFNVALALSLVTLAGGGLIVVGRRSVGALQARLAPRTDGVDVYRATVRGVLRGSGWVTGVVQSGSLPVYAGVVLATAALAPLLAMVGGDWWPGWPDAIGRPGQIPAAGMLVAGATAATVATRRFTAALLLGVVGYGMALLFVVQGAPDLALTQFAVETLSVVVFLLVLRRLPDRFEREALPLVGRMARVAVSALVGVWVVVGAIAFSGARTAAPVSDEMVARALPEGYGENVVNVILVDIRGLDTMGEITVLVAAGIGIAALARAGRPPRGRPERRSIRERREEAAS